MATSGTPVPDAPKKKKHRSPAYPAINLSQAIKRAEEFYKRESKNPASFNAAAAHWNYKPTSSGALLAAAALKSFGLMNELESATGRTLQLSPLGLRIVADKRPESADRDTAIKEAALKPKIHALIWRRWNGLPSDPELAYRLENEWSFNTNSINGFIQQLKDTVLFAKFNESDKVSADGEDNLEDEQPVVKVGDFIQWESQGMHQFREPKRVRGLSEDGKFVFVDDSPTGAPITEVSIEEPPASSLNMPVLSQPVGGARSGGGTAMRQDTFSVDEGDIILRWPTPLSEDSISLVKGWLKLVEQRLGISPITKQSEPSSEKPLT